MKHLEATKPLRDARIVSRVAAIIGHIKSQEGTHVQTPNSELPDDRLGVTAATDAMNSREQAIEQEQNLRDN
jgi:hypothetical protein